jgi:hypothetical protein
MCAHDSTRTGTHLKARGVEDGADDVLVDLVIVHAHYLCTKLGASHQGSTVKCFISHTRATDTLDLGSLYIQGQSMRGSQLGNKLGLGTNPIHASGALGCKIVEQAAVLALAGEANPPGIGHSTGGGIHVHISRFHCL